MDGIVDNNPDSELYKLHKELLATRTTTFGKSSGVNDGLLRGDGMIEEELRDDALVFQEINTSSNAPAVSLSFTEFEEPHSDARKHHTDIIQALLNLFGGSKDPFVNEYRNLLSERLLSNIDFCTDNEVRILELCKLRFGENVLQSCEVMLKDIADSNRVNKNIHDLADGQSIASLDAMVISRFFWPDEIAALAPQGPDGAKEGHTIKLHPRIQTMMDEYGRRFSQLKTPRKLIWQPFAGLVNLELELGHHQSLNVWVSPIHASVIMHFEDQSLWTVGELARVMGLNCDALHKRLLFWVSQRVLRLQSGSDVSGTPLVDLTFEISTEDTCTGQAAIIGNPSNTKLTVDDSDDVSDVASSTRDIQLVREREMYERFIVGMLTNLEALPADRIHNFLKLVAGGSYEQSLSQLTAMLGAMVTSGTLELEDGVYRLKPSSL